VPFEFHAVWYVIPPLLCSRQSETPRSPEKKRPQLDPFADLRDCRQSTAASVQQADSESELVQYKALKSNPMMPVTHCDSGNRMRTCFRSCPWPHAESSAYRRAQRSPNVTSHLLVGLSPTYLHGCRPAKWILWKSFARVCGLESCKWWCQPDSDCFHGLSDCLSIYVNALCCITSIKALYITIPYCSST